MLKFFFTIIIIKKSLHNDKPLNRQVLQLNDCDALIKVTNDKLFIARKAFKNIPVVKEINYFFPIYFL